MSITIVFKALANEKRLLLLGWLKAPERHFPPRPEGDFRTGGVCVGDIALKLGVSPSTASAHLRLLTQAGLLKACRVQQWTFYVRNERRIQEINRMIQVAL